MSAPQWPGIKDAKHVSKRVKPGVIVEAVTVSAHTLNVGDKIVEQRDNNGRPARYCEVSSVRYTRRKVLVIVNGYLSYNYNGQVDLITRMYENESVSV